MRSSVTIPRVQAIPGVGRASLCVDGAERDGYEFGEGDTRPYLFPLIDPSGACLTRLGHPNPIGHEHHKSVWFGHQSIAGINFWEDRIASDIRVRHRCVRLYHDGHDRGGLVADLDWWAHGRPYLNHEPILVIEPTARGGLALELQSRFESSGGEPVAVAKTNDPALSPARASGTAEPPRSGAGLGDLRRHAGLFDHPPASGQSCRARARRCCDLNTRF
jgi:hypothetical protein